MNENRRTVRLRTLLRELLHKDFTKGLASLAGDAGALGVEEHP